MSNVERARTNDKHWNWVEEKTSNVGLGKLGFARLKNLLILIYFQNKRKKYYLIIIHNLFSLIKIFTNAILGLYLNFFFRNAIMRLYYLKNLNLRKN